jgi:P63C domain
MTKLSRRLRQRAAMGGAARAEALSPEQRSEIARTAALERWGKELPRETHAGSLRVGEIGEIPCSVLDNELRVLSTRGVTRAFGGRTTGAAKQTDGARQMPPFLASGALRPFISNDLMARVISPVEFRPIHGGRTAFGYDATILPDLCRVILAARKAGALRPNQAALADAAETLLQGFATVGIIALIDEATGFQDARAKNALAVILERFIAKEIRPWVKTFPDDFYREVYRLQGWAYPPKAVTKPWHVGKLTNQVVYERLAPGVLEELKRITPRTEKGALKHKYHQRLTTDVGHPKLREHLGGVLFTMRLSRTWTDFMVKLDQIAPRFGHTYQMPLDDGS